MQQPGREEISVSDEDSYSSSSGSCSEVESQSSASQSLAKHVEDASASHQSQSSFVSGKQSALGPEGIQAAQAAASTQPLDQFESPIEKEDPLDRSEVIRRLSQSVLAMSSKNLNHSTDEDSPHLSHHVAACQWQSADIAAAERKASGTSLDAASGRYEAEEPEKGTGANDAPSSAQQSSLHRGQALTQVKYLPYPTPPLLDTATNLITSHLQDGAGVDPLLLLKLFALLSGHAWTMMVT